MPSYKKLAGECLNNKSTFINGYADIFGLNFNYEYVKLPNFGTISKGIGMIDEYPDDRDTIHKYIPNIEHIDDVVYRKIMLINAYSKALNICRPGSLYRISESCIPSRCTDEPEYKDKCNLRNMCLYHKHSNKAKDLSKNIIALLNIYSMFKMLKPDLFKKTIFITKSDYDNPKEINNTLSIAVEIAKSNEYIQNAYSYGIEIDGKIYQGDETLNRRLCAATQLLSNIRHDVFPGYYTGESARQAAALLLDQQVGEDRARRLLQESTNPFVRFLFPNSSTNADVMS